MRHWGLLKGSVKSRDPSPALKTSIIPSECWESVVKLREADSLFRELTCLVPELGKDKDKVHSSPKWSLAHFQFSGRNEDERKNCLHR